MAINKDISTIKERHGYLTSNDRVHNPSDENNLTDMYGATTYGQKGVGNHNNLGNIFKNANAFVNFTSQADNAEGSDFIIASSYLLGRNVLSGELFEEEKQNQLAALAEEKAPFVQQQVGFNSGDPEFDAAQAQIDAIDARITALNTDTDNDGVFDGLGTELESSAFNPDFATTPLTFSYIKNTVSPVSHERANDGISAFDKSPNIAYPASNTNFDNIEASSTYVPGSGSGGFFPTNSRSIKMAAQKIVARYKQQAP